MPSVTLEPREGMAPSKKTPAVKRCSSHMSMARFSRELSVASNLSAVSDGTDTTIWWKAANQNDLETIKEMLVHDGCGPTLRAPARRAVRYSCTLFCADAVLTDTTVVTSGADA